MARPDFIEHCTELLAPLGAVRTRRMFGGWGFYVDELFLALVAFDRFYLKVDADSQAPFEAEGCEPFVYEAQGRRVALGYWTAPPEAMESPALMQPWARLALQAALRARALKRAAPGAGRAPRATPRARTSLSATKPAAKRRPR